MLKLYVFVLKSLSLPQQAVQAGHAVSKIASQNPKIDWSNQTFVYLRASAVQLKRLLLGRNNNDPTYSYFIEPDYDHKLTAVAVFGKDNEYKTYRLIQ